MLLSISFHQQPKKQTGVLTIGRTRALAKDFREMVASHVDNDVSVDAACYSSSLNSNKQPDQYRAIVIVVDSLQAFSESIALIEALRVENMASIIMTAFTGTGTFSKIKYYLAGADYCMKFDAADENDGLLSEIFSSLEWQKKDNLILDPTRMCLIGNDKKLDISFAEMKILEAFSQTKSHILSHDEIARVMSLNINFYDPRALEKSISRLRRKIKDMCGVNAILSIRGYGYRLIRGLIATT